MHHLYPTSKGDPLCPLGFHPQVRWPTRCKRCFRDYKEHVGNKKGSLKDTTASSPSLSPWEPSQGRAAEATDKRTWASTSNLSKEDTKLYSQPEAKIGWTSASDLSSVEIDAASKSNPVSNAAPKSRLYAGSQSDSFNFRRYSNDETRLDPPQKLQIQGVIDNSNGTTSNTDVEFIIQVRKTQGTDSSKSPSKSSDVSSKNTEDEISEKGGKTEKNEIEKLKAQLNDMRARCEKVEKEKSDILLRRLATMDTVSNKSSSNEVMKLQKSVKDLQAKNEALTEEKTSLASRVKTLEKEANTKTSRNERDRQNDELRSKLKAAETLCETLMDENEDMKKEIRELEEEIYEMQDNFREEQADEYTSLRKDLEQSNKNCRILSFKLRKVERKAEQLESEKTDLEKKYEEMKKIEDALKKIGSEYKNRTQKKATDYTTKIQLRKMVDDMEKEIGDVVGILANIVVGKDVEVPNMTTSDIVTKYDKLSKEYELLKQKLEKATKELAAGDNETRKVDKGKSADDNKNTDSQGLKKKLDEAVSSREAERKTFEVEKSALQEEKEKLKSKLLSLSAEKLKVYNEVVQLKKDLEIANSSGKDNAKMESVLNDLRKELSLEKEKCNNLQNDLTSYMERESRITKTLASVELTKTQLDGELKRVKQELENTKSSTSTKMDGILSELADVRKEKEKLKSQYEKEIESKESEIGTLKKKIVTLEKAGLNAKKMNELKQTYNERILNLENEVKKSLKDYTDLNSKYTTLSELRGHLESENQILGSKLLDHKHDLSSNKAELRAIQETFKKKEAEWVSEKLRFEERLRYYEKSPNKSIEENKEEINRLKKENSSLTEQLADVRKINEDLTSKLKDYNSVSKIHRNFSADTSALESELRKAKNALSNADRLRKADLAQCKMRYEHRITAINDEIQSIQNQLSRYKRERDTYKHMLEGAQKTIADLKTVRQRRQSTTSTGKSDEDEETLALNISVLEKQISCMEDELSESRLEASKLKTELVSEKSAWQVKLSEMQSRINELEEERILASGRTKIPGLKVRMELAWQKEREEQQRLLQETTTLARDLRQTLFEIERERDKERLENKRKQDQQKKIFDEEKEENKKKLIELQCDLLELRDAHAKLRTSNEKMRREKERHEREREELRDIIASKRRQEQNEARNVNILLQQVDDLMKLFPELSTKMENKTPDTYTPTPPRRLKGPKSRESSPMLESKEDIKGSSSNLGGRTEKLEYTIGKLMEVAKELQQSKKASDESSSTKTKKFGKRSTSIDNDTSSRTTPSRSIGDKTHKPSLKRKSLSLEQTSGKNDQIIWGTDSNVSSMQSLDGSEMGDPRHFSLQRDSSVDSRLSGGSTKSEMLQRDKKYSKGIIRKITTKLTKSASVDDPNSSFDFSIQTSGSEASINEEGKREKKNLKKKLTDMFKRGSRSNSLDRKAGSQDTSRPSSRTSMVSKT
ncbi:titin homolog [Cephus cinctus]|uniref:Titin homolog n=1 Tax=Cephus cinctus TaxID=211228 RepID=A0AAJ7VXL4_CEPCN|nr:titin homolog [Cephus cinctus]XP_015588019.1 titin homolog [Cephus cinctus]XP_024936965.1 titin homolog [Cephus cinctus]